MREVMFCAFLLYFSLPVFGQSVQYEITSQVVGAGPTFAALGHFDNDGISDIAVVNREGCSISMILSSGAADEGTENLIPLCESEKIFPFDILSDDFNGDNIDDLVITYFPDPGDGHLAGRGIGYIPGPDYSQVFKVDGLKLPVGIASGDLDDDGRIDVAVADVELKKVIIYSIESGTNEPPEFKDSGEIVMQENGPYRIEVADFDGDGKPDIVASSRDDGYAAIYENRSSGEGDFSFGVDPVVTLDHAHAPIGVFATDLDQDAKMDLIVSDISSEKTVYFYHNDGTRGDGAFGFADPIQESFGSLNPIDNVYVPVTAADFNGDGFPDPVVGVRGTGKLLIFISAGSRTYTRAVLGPLEVDGDVFVGGIGLAAGDLEGNGLADIVTTSGDGGATDKIFIVKTTSPLPVELVAFDAVWTGADVKLTWRTASETNNAGFEVQARAEGGAWEKLAFVEGAGTTTEAQQYAYHVRDVSPGTYAFRLRQSDFDGTATYGPEVEVRVELDEAYTLSAPYPNPFTAHTSVDLIVRDPQRVTVAVYNALGQRVQTLFDGFAEAHTPQTFRLDAGNLSSGLYIYRVAGETFAETRTVRLVR